MTGGFITVTSDRLADTYFSHWPGIIDGIKDGCLVFTLDDGQTWEEKEQEIRETIEKYWR